MIEAIHSTISVSMKSAMSLRASSSCTDSKIPFRSSALASTSPSLRRAMTLDASPYHGWLSYGSSHSSSLRRVDLRGADMRWRPSGSTLEPQYMQ